MYRRDTRKRETRKVTLVGLIVNLALIAGKITAGIIGNSDAVVADGVHSGSDMISDLMILIGLVFWAKPKDRDHPYGHERIETLTTLVLAMMLFGAGILITYRASTDVLRRHESVPGLVALYAAVAAIVSKEVLARWTRRVGARMKSLAVVANAWHHRSDALSSVPVALAVLVAVVAPAWWFVDHLAAIVVSVFIIFAAYRIAFPSFMQLIDTAPPAEVQEALEKVMRSSDGIISVHQIRARYLGSKILAEAHVEVLGSVTVEEGHRIAEEAKESVLEKFPEIEDITIHIEPVGDFAKRGKA